MSSYISYRRSLLDKLLNEHLSQVTGPVLDIGGERKNQRGLFRPSYRIEKQCLWYVVNIDSDAAPDVYCDAHMLSFPSNSMDCVLCCEVLEHIKDPRQCCREIWRVLQPGGVAFISVPFLFPVHADPDDYQRFTPSGLKYLTSDFALVRIEPMGGTLGTLGELIVQAGNSIRRYSSIRKMVKLIGMLMVRAEKNIGAEKFYGAFSTGYFVKAYKL